MVNEPFGIRVQRIAASVSSLARDAFVRSRYVLDTANEPGQADEDLLAVAERLEAAASDLRTLHARIQQERADLSLQAAE